MRDEQRIASAEADVVQRNVESLLADERERKARRKWGDVLGEWIAFRIGTIAFLTLNTVATLGWIVANSTLPRPWDPYPFGLLTLALTIESIVLMIFVLIAQNRMQEESDRRAALDLQINLLNEHETTQVLRIVKAMAAQMGVPGVEEEKVRELMETVDPREVLEKIEQSREG